MSDTELRDLLVELIWQLRVATWVCIVAPVALVVADERETRRRDDEAEDRGRTGDRPSADRTGTGEDR